jgi:tRNA (mo5U34)-methyltransferase
MRAPTPAATGELQSARPDGSSAPSAEEVRREVSSLPLWYHTIELGHGVVTPGWFDLRPIVERLPWPDVRGKRCLEIGPWDGFLSFELERRGAAEVVATDISDPSQWDLSLRTRQRGVEVLSKMAGPEHGVGLGLAKRILGSRIERIEVSIYDVSPETVGEFDVVVCGSLLLHLKNPILALERVRSVCREAFLSAEQVNPFLTRIAPRRPLAHLRGGDRGQWWIPNAAAHRLMLESAMFDLERSSGLYAIPLGSGHPQRTSRSLAGRVLDRALAGGSGVPHVAVLARPA